MKYHTIRLRRRDQPIMTSGNLVMMQYLTSVFHELLDRYIFYDIRFSRNKSKLLQNFSSMRNFCSFILLILKSELLRLYNIIQSSPLIRAPDKGAVRF